MRVSSSAIRRQSSKKKKAVVVQCCSINTGNACRRSWFFGTGGASSPPPSSSVLTSRKRISSSPASVLFPRNLSTTNTTKKNLNSTATATSSTRCSSSAFLNNNNNSSSSNKAATASAATTESSKNSSSVSSYSVSSSSTTAKATTTTTTSASSLLQESPDAVWERLTDRLLLLLSPKRRNDAEEVQELRSRSTSTMASTSRANMIAPTIRYWIQQRPITRKSVENAWKLWELYVMNHDDVDQEEEAQAQDEPRMLLEGILDHWYLAISQNKNKGGGGRGRGRGAPSYYYYYYTPFEIYQQVLQPLLVIGGDTEDTTTSSMIVVSAKSVALVLSAMAHHHDGDQNSVDPYLGMEILDWYLSKRKKMNYNDNYNDDKDTSSLVVACNAAMTLWSKSSRSIPEAGDEAMKLLRRMQSDLNDLQIQPNVRTYACVLQALAAAASSSASSSSNPNNKAAQQAVDLFDEMMMLSSNEKINPNDVCALHLLTALTRCGRVEEAHQYLQRWIDEWEKQQQFQQQFDSGSGGGGTAGATATAMIKPTPHLFSVVMSAYAKSSEPGEELHNVEKVHELLLQLHHFLQQEGHGDDDSGSCGTTTYDDDDETIGGLATALNNVLEAYANNNLPEQGESILNHLLDAESDWIDLTSFNIVMNAWARVSNSRRSNSSSTSTAGESSFSSGAVERSEALLRKAIENGYEPNVVSYTTVMKAWARSDRREAPDRCEAFLRAMWDNACDDDITNKNSSMVQPTSVTYATVLYAHSRSSAPDSPLRAEAVFRDQMERYKDGLDPKLKPTEQTYVTLMTIWNRHASKLKKKGKGGGDRISQAAARSQYYFDSWRANCISQGIPLTERPYNALLESKKRIGDGPAAERILQQILNDWEGGNDRVKPTRYTFHAVLQAHASNSRPHKAPQQSEELLRRMESGSKPGSHNKRWSTIDCKPNTTTYATVLQCWARAASKRGDAPERAQALLRRMEELAKNNNSSKETLRPNSFCYALVLQAWANSKRPDAAEQIQGLMDEMWERYYEHGEAECRPNSTAYTSLLTAWARSGREDALFKALALLNEMHDRYSNSSKNIQQHRRNSTGSNHTAVVVPPPPPSQPEEEERPNCLHYSAVINGFAKIGDVDNASALLERVEHDPDIYPNAGCYHGYMLALLNSARHGNKNDIVGASSANSTDTASTSVFASQIEDVLRKLQHPKSKVRPTFLMYTTAIGAWGQQQQQQGYSNCDASSSSINRAYALLQDYVRDLQASRNTKNRNIGPFLAYIRVVANATTGALTPQEKVTLIDETFETMLSLGIRPTEAMKRILDKCRSSPTTTSSFGDDGSNINNLVNDAMGCGV